MRFDTAQHMRMSQQMERLMRMSDENFPLTKRTLEVNPNHLAIRNMGELLKVDRESAELEEWAQFLVAYVLLAAGQVEAVFGLGCAGHGVLPGTPAYPG